MTQHDALLAAVCAAPDDDLPRLVYADWCDENGDPDRAEFIRTQIEIAKGAKGKKLAALQQREKELLAEHQAKWTEPLSDFTDNNYSNPFAFRRGFVESISIDHERLAKHGDELFRTSPIRTLMIGGLSDLDLIQKCKHLLRISTLDLTGSALDDRYGGSAKLFNSKYLANVMKLIARSDNDSGHLDAGALRAIVRSKHLANLRMLDMGGNWRLFYERTDAEQQEITRLLTRIGNLPSLAELHLDNAGLLALSIQELATQPWLSRLKVLDLHANDAGDDGGRALAESPHLDRLEQLDLRYNEVFDPETGSSTPMSDEVKRLLKRRFGKRVLV